MCVAQDVSLFTPVPENVCVSGKSAHGHKAMIWPGNSNTLLDKCSGKSSSCRVSILLRC